MIRIGNIIFILFITLLVFVCVTGCKKEGISAPPCQSVTYIFKSNGDTIIHWHKVCFEELEKFKQSPKESEIIPGCDSRIQVLIIQPDKCIINERY